MNLLSDKGKTSFVGRRFFSMKLNGKINLAKRLPFFSSLSLETFGRSLKVDRDSTQAFVSIFIDIILMESHSDHNEISKCFLQHTRCIPEWRSCEYFRETTCVRRSGNRRKSRWKWDKWLVSRAFRIQQGILILALVTIIVIVVSPLYFDLIRRRG